ncbi:MAG: hypothetical protein M1838_003251 [Thelocarpon superellum]|nr:MAG: hypothetical protein M1838_003251 [Thelocarpon superellum]
MSRASRSHRSPSRSAPRLSGPTSDPGDGVVEGVPAHDTIAPVGDRPYGGHRLSVSSTLSASSNQRKPTRSFYHRSNRPASAHTDPPQDSPQRVREQTAELASYALSEAGSSFRSDAPLPPRLQVLADTASIDSALSRGSENEENITYGPSPLPPTGVIEEVSEPVSPAKSDSPIPPPEPSYLSELLNSQSQSPPHDARDDGGPGKYRRRNHYAASSMTSEGDEADEATSLLPKNQDTDPRPDSIVQDVEAQRTGLRTPWTTAYRIVLWPEKKLIGAARVMANPKAWDMKMIFRKGVVQPVHYIPAVILGILLNILDALSYGMILFPLGQPIFASLGPDGISMFYVSCVISQLVYSWGGSVFKGGIGSEMIEVVPFFHKMAFTILAQVGEENPKAVVATTILSYAISSVLTGVVFFAMGACKIGALIGFFPRHILIGCIGGVGWFLVATGLEVSARLDGNLVYDLPTLRKLFQLDTVFLWLTPLILALCLLLLQHFIKNPLLVPCYFLVIPAVFYFLVAAVPALQLPALRDQGWVFGMPVAGEPFYHFYTLYDLSVVDWSALAKTIPAMFALTFFGVLHVPINVPALGFSTGEDNVDVDRELIAHGISNALSGFAGSIQNYLVYTNSLLFIRSGGDSRVAGTMLAFGTFGVMLIGPSLIGYIPIMVVGALIFLLGIDLLREALYETWGRVHRLEYLTILAIVVTMGAWDFVIGIFVGIVLACVNFVVQTSRVSAIRATYSGEVAGSTVRRHAVQRQFLRQVGQQTHVTKLAGFLFFGTIVSVENRLRGLLDDKAFDKRPIRFLVLDLQHVVGIDFSAAEAFTRISRVLAKKSVTMVVCGVGLEGDIGKSLRSVGFLDEENGVHVFVDLNSALEYCENQLLRAFYLRSEALGHRSAQPRPLNSKSRPSFSMDTSFSSPRRQHLHQVAHNALNEQDVAISSRWQHFKQPLPLMLQTFQGLTEKNEDFWFRACPYFERFEYIAGTTLYNRGDQPNGFYLLEQGILRADYDLPQGKYYESIVAGTTCGELPFFSETSRTATVATERDCVAWLLDHEHWEELRTREADVAQELLRISLKLTSERMAAITS